MVAGRESARREPDASVSLTAVALLFAAAFVLFLCLGVLEQFYPRKMDGFMAKIAGRLYTFGVSERSRLRWIRFNGLFSFGACALVIYTFLVLFFPEVLP